MIAPLITPEEALDALGSPFLGQFVKALGQTRDDLKQFRNLLPEDWDAQWTERGLAGVIHDRLWARVTADIELIDASVAISDNGTTRTLCIDERIALRVKRHDTEGQISGYRTAGSEQFYMGTLAGMETQNLTIGYEWLSLEREIGRAVLSKQTSTRKDPLWVIGVGTPGAGSQPIPFDPIIPPRPELDLSAIAAATRAEEGGTS